MSGNLEFSLIMRLRDLAARDFARSNKEMQAGIKGTEKATQGLTRTVANLGRQRHAAEQLGVRTEQNIRREIQRTQAAYNRMQKSGNMGLREQARAADAYRIRLRELNNEMGKYTLAQKAMHGLQRGAQVGGAVVAAGYALSRPIGRTMDYGMRLAHMANTAYSDRDVTGRIAGKKELDGAIKAAVRAGGGSRESAADALDTLLASGAMTHSQATSMLPSLMRASTASGALPEELATIGIRGMQNFGLKPDQMGHIFDMAIAAGQAGGFELKDMAKWLPQQMAAAKLTGFNGDAGLAKLLAANQAAAITAGTKDEAGNNLANLLQKVASKEVATNVKNVTGYDLTGSIAANKAKGLDALDVFVGIIDKYTAGNKAYQDLQTRLATASDDERRNIMQSQVDILQGSSIGQVIQDQQAIKALVGIMGNREYMRDAKKKILNSDGTTDTNFEVIANEAAFKKQQADNQWLNAEQSVFGDLTQMIGDLMGGFADWAAGNEDLAASAVGAAEALTVAAAAGLAFGGIGALGDKGGSGAGKVMRGAGLLLARGASLARMGSVPGLIVGGIYEGGSTIYNAIKGNPTDNMLSRTVDGATNFMFGDSIGGLIYDLLHQQQEPQQVSVVVSVENGEIVAAVEEQQAVRAGRH